MEHVYNRRRRQPLSAPENPPVREERPVCSLFERCKSCPYPRHGFICRSPMAEFMMKDLAREAGLSEQFEISSAATSTEEIGNPVYLPVRKLLSKHGISCAGKTARPLTNADYDRFDLLIGMDQENLCNMYWICGGDYADKLHLLSEYAGLRGDIPDPWYTRDFHATWQAVEAGCRGLLEQLRGNIDGNEQAKSLYRH